ncbi:hypothetical protein ACWD3I_26065 [Streptomyces sp. NPDC002817]|uniref:hypothetical protein n=1 Tax=Streptomyces sp. NPDC088357 TaxID=3154655 RepID=UPI0034219FD8
MHSIWIAVDGKIPKQVKDVTEGHKRLRARRSAAPRWSTYGLRGTEAKTRRAQWRTEVQRQRLAGELLDTVDVLVEYGVREELAVRGWDREWDPAPEEAWEQGRWPGSRDRGLAGYPDRLSARLDGDLVELAVAACWWTSAPAIELMHAWRDRNPGIAPPRYEIDAEGRRRLGGPLAEYARLADQITTTGVIWRAGVTRGLAQGRTLIPAQQSAGGPTAPN